MQDYLALVRRIRSLDALHYGRQPKSQVSLVRQLPRDILEHVLRFMAGDVKVVTSRVCKLFRELVGEFGVPRFNMGILMSRTDAPIISAFYAASGDNVRDIKQRHWLRQLSEGIFKGTRSVCLSTCDVDLGVISILNRDCSRISDLDLSLTNVTQALIAALDLPNLSSLSLSHCPRMEFCGLHTASCLTQLTSLCMSNSRHLNTASVEIILATFGQLRTLDVTGCTVGEVCLSGLMAPLRLERLLVGQTLFSDRTLSHLASLCPSLMALNVSRCEFLTAAGVGAVLRSCSGMRELIYSYAVGVDELRLSPMFRKLQIVDLSYSDVSGEVVQELLAGSSLVSLSIYQCPTVRRDSLRDGKLLGALRLHQSVLSNESKRYFQLRWRP